MTFRDTLKTYLDRRIFWVFLMGCASGFPWVLIGSAMSGWLKDAGLTRTAIGLFGSVFAVYAINFLWAPFLDRVKLPLLKSIGQRRSWILLMQSLMLGLTCLIATIDPTVSLLMTSLVALGIAIASATQDIAIDAYRIDHFSSSPKHQIPAASAMAVIGWWTGYSLPGYVAFSYADSLGWSQVYWILAGFCAVLMLFTLLIGEPESERDSLHAELESKYSQLAATSTGRALRWLTITIWEPLADFLRRNGVQTALAILLFIFLFKIGEAFLGRMSIVFYKEIGFSNAQIADYTKMLGWFAIIGFTLLGSIINVRLGLVKGLLIGGSAMALSNLMFAWIAIAGPKEWLFAATIIVDNFTTAFSSVAFVSFLTALTGKAFSATQYALLASIGNLGRTTLASASGWFVDVTGSWVLFFVLTTVLVLPGLALLFMIRHRISTLKTED
jgi:PAT family beta-lactamase induction signal transducer AmpG